MPFHNALMPRDWNPETDAPKFSFKQQDTTKPKAKPKQDADKDKRFNAVAMRYETHNRTHEGADEWFLHGYEKDRLGELTERDKEVLNERGLESLIDKARIIKPFWCQHMSRKMITAELQRQKVQGCKEATIGKICAALSCSNGEVND